MTAEEFNTLTIQHVNDHLSPLGFKKSGIHFYLHQKPDIMVFFKKTFRGTFEGFYLTLTHDFMPGTADEKGRIKIPGYLENYPFSISLPALREQYARHRSAADFTYDTNFMTREVLTTSRHTISSSFAFLTFEKLMQDRQEAGDYIKSSIDIVVAEGMKLLHENLPLISYLAVTRHKRADDTTLNKFKAELEKYLKDNGIEIPERKKSLFGRFFNK